MDLADEGELGLLDCYQEKMGGTYLGYFTAIDLEVCIGMG